MVACSVACGAAVLPLSTVVALLVLMTVRTELRARKELVPLKMAKKMSVSSSVMERYEV
jgi:hypothetical protein